MITKCLVRMIEEVYMSEKKKIESEWQNGGPFVCNSTAERPKTNEQKASGPPALPPVERQWSTGQHWPFAIRVSVIGSDGGTGQGSPASPKEGASSQRSTAPSSGRVPPCLSEVVSEVGQGDGDKQDDG